MYTGGGGGVSTQPFIAVTWVVTLSSFAEQFADSCVLTSHYSFFVAVKRILTM